MAFSFLITGAEKPIKLRSYLLNSRNSQLRCWGMPKSLGGGGSIKTFSDRKNRSLGAVFDIQFTEQRFKMTFDRFTGELGDIADFFVAQPFGY
jgi:hypothetical protein